MSSVLERMAALESSTEEAPPLNVRVRLLEEMARTIFDAIQEAGSAELIETLEDHLLVHFGGIEETS